MHLLFILTEHLPVCSHWLVKVNLNWPASLTRPTVNICTHCPCPVQRNRIFLSVSLRESKKDLWQKIVLLFQTVPSSDQARPGQREKDQSPGQITVPPFIFPLLTIIHWLVIILCSLIFYILLCSPAHPYPRMKVPPSLSLLLLLLFIILVVSCSFPRVVHLVAWCLNLFLFNFTLSLKSIVSATKFNCVQVKLTVDVMCDVSPASDVSLHPSFLLLTCLLPSSLSLSLSLFEMVF